MPQSRAHYSVVQYVPDDSRAEAANVGVVLFVPSRQWLEVKTSGTLERVRQFFRPGRQELRRIELSLESLEHRMMLARSEFTGDDDLAHFASARADTIRLSSPRLMLTDNPVLDLDSLYVELVGDRSRAERAEAAGSTLPTRLAEVFGRLEAQNKLWRPGRITIPTIRKQFDVPIAYRNGRVNYVRPESLSDTRKLDDRLAKLGFNGQLIHLHPIGNEEGQLVVLSTDPDASPEVEERYDRTLREFNVEFVPYSEANAFADHVESTAH